MSSLWGRLEALKARGWGRGSQHRCACGQCRPAGWALHTGAAPQLSPGFPRFTQLDPVLKAMPRVLAEAGLLGDAAHPEAFELELRALTSIFECILRLGDSYAVPVDPEEENLRFAWQLWELLQRLLGETRSHPHLPWPDFVDAMSEALGTDEWGLEKLVRHHDPGLQLIRLPSFRLFVELQLLQRYLRLRVAQMMEADDAGDSHRRILQVYACVAATPDLVVFYARQLGLGLPDCPVGSCAPCVYQDLLQNITHSAPSLRKDARKGTSAETNVPSCREAEMNREPSPADRKQGLSRGQRKRRARAAAKASRTAEPVRPRSPSGPPSRPLDYGAQEEADDLHEDAVREPALQTPSAHCPSELPEAAEDGHTPQSRGVKLAKAPTKSGKKAPTVASLLARMWELSMEEEPPRTAATEATAHSSD